MVRTALIAGVTGIAGAISPSICWRAPDGRSTGSRAPSGAGPARRAAIAVDLRDAAAVRAALAAVRPTICSSPPWLRQATEG